MESKEDLTRIKVNTKKSHMADENPISTQMESLPHRVA